MSATTSKLSQELLGVIQSHIKVHGALPLPRFMSLCMQHPTLGYYARQRDAAQQQASGSILGSRGDFITSPEISQVFGELLGVWFVSQWQAQGSPPKTRVIELGPGKGTLMDDVLRTFERITPFGKTLQSVHMIESSAFMRQQQENKLAPRAENSFSLNWHHQVEELKPDEDKDTFTMLMAHEFFDALPINVFEKRPEGWREALVTQSSSDTVVGGKPGPALKMALSPSPTLGSQLYCKHPRLENLSTGTRVEISPDSYATAAHCGKLIGSTTGAGLIVDYGDDRFFSNSFRGFRKHQIVDPLTELGDTDLTANVDFEWLAEALGLHATPTSLMTQHDFLGYMGLGMRVENLMRRAGSEEQSQRIEDAALRLVDSLGMGQQYKILGFVPKVQHAVAIPATYEPPFPFNMKAKMQQADSEKK